MAVQDPRDSEPVGWMTLQAAAVYTSTSVKTIRRFIARRELPAYLCGKRGFRVLRNDLDALMRRL